MSHNDDDDDACHIRKPGFSNSIGRQKVYFMAKGHGFY